MERTRVFKTMSGNWEIKLDLINQFQKEIQEKALKLREEMKGWTRWEHNGRIYVGWKRINCEPLINVYANFWFTPLSTFYIVHRKVRIWLDKRK